MPRYLLDHEPLSGAVETFDYDEAQDLAVIERAVDVEPLIDANKRVLNETEGRTAGGGRLHARIPLDVVLLWRQRYGIDALNKHHWPAVKRLLNDSEWRHLRTSPGVI